MSITNPGETAVRGNLKILALFLLSGAAGLIYELVWVRRLILVFGGTTYAITTVLVAFMAGLGLGSYLSGRICHRLQRMLRAYGLLEISIGCYALLIPLLFGLAEGAYRGLYPLAAATPWLLTLSRFLLSAVILLIPTTCMGATLPILVRHITLYGGGLGRSVGYLYGINTLGAVLGTLLAGFVLIPGLGSRNATLLAAAINIGIGLTAVFLLDRRSVPVHPVEASRRDPARPSPKVTPSPLAMRRVVMIGFAVSGFAAMVYQITWTRALVLSLGSSTYSFTCLVSAFILGLALGSLIVTPWVDRWSRLVSQFGVLELLIGLIAVLVVPIYGRIPFAVASLVHNHSQHFDTLLFMQFLLIIAVTIVPTLMMGAIFPLVIRILAREGGDAGEATGRAYAINTIGTIAGSFIAGFVLIRSDVLGVQNSIFLASILNAVAGFALIAVDPAARGVSRLRRLLAPAAVLAAIPVLFVLFGRWDPLVLSSAPFLGRSVSRETLRSNAMDYFADGVDMTVSVYHSKRDPDRLVLTVNGKPDASTGMEDMTTQLLLGHLPALIGPAGKRACVIGLGSGMTLAALARHPSYERLDCVEISKEVEKGASYFQPFIYNVLTDDRRVHLIHADGRNHLLLGDTKYDLIISEPSNPWIAGVANLFTQEFFSLCKSRLTEDGLLAVWLQGYSTSIDDFRMVLRTLFTVSDDVSLWGLYYGDFLLVVGKSPRSMALDEFLRRYEEPAVRTDLYRIGLRRPSDLLGRYVASGSTLKKWVESAPINADDDTRLEFSAPRNLYTTQAGPTRALLPLQQRVLADLFQGASGSPPPPGIEDEIAAVVAGQWTPIRYNDLAGRGKTEPAVRLLLDAYKANPTNHKLYAIVADARQQFLDNPSAWTGNPEVAALVDELKRSEAPTVLPRRVGDRDDLVRVLRKWAAQSLECGRWSAAADHLAEARHLDPGDTGLTRDLVDALEHAGRTAEADSIRGGPRAR